MFCRRKDYAKTRRSKTEDVDDDGGNYLMLATPTISSINKGICMHTAWAVKSEAHSKVRRRRLRSEEWGRRGSP